MNIVVDGYNICYKTTGTGDKTVVILQGWGTDLGVYDSVAGVIDGSRYRVIQFDFPGFGGSDEPKEPWDVDGFADFSCRFMEVMQVKQATLIGHSYGGQAGPRPHPGAAHGPAGNGGGAGAGPPAQHERHPVCHPVLRPPAGRGRAVNFSINDRRQANGCDYRRPF